MSTLLSLGGSIIRDIMRGCISEESGRKDSILKEVTRGQQKEMRWEGEGDGRQREKRKGQRQNMNELVELGFIPDVSPLPSTTGQNFPMVI